MRFDTQVAELETLACLIIFRGYLKNALSFISHWNVSYRSSVLLQKPLWNFWTPYCEAFVSCRAPSNRSVFVYEIAIGVVLNHVLVRGPPVIKYSAFGQLKVFIFTVFDTLTEIPKYVSRFPRHSYILLLPAIGAPAAGYRSRVLRMNNGEHESSCSSS